MARLVSGPAAAISASSRGRLGSPSSVAAPPKMKSVMSRTRSPKRRATSAWLSSWASTDPKKRSEITAPTTQYSPSSQLGIDPRQLAGGHRVGHDQRDHEPRRVQADLDAEDATDADRLAHGARV